MSELSAVIDALEPGESHSLLRRETIKRYDPDKAGEVMRTLVSRLAMSGKRRPGKKEFLVESFGVLNHARDAVVYGAIITRIK